MLKPLDSALSGGRGCRVGTWRRAAVVVAAALALSGCAALRVSYNNADSIAGFYSGQYFDADSAQKAALKTHLATLQVWHRRTQLPEYVRQLTETKTRLERGPKAADVQWVIDNIESDYRRIVAASLDDAAAMLATLTPAQIEHLQQRFEKNNVKYVTETRLNRSVDERRRAQFKKVLEQAEEWVGPLSADQERDLRERVASMPLIDRLRNEERLRRQRELIEILGQRQDKAQFVPRIRAWLTTWEAGRSAELQRLAAVANAERAQHVVAFWNQLSPAQQAHALNRLQGYIDDVKALAGQGQRVNAALPSGLREAIAALDQ